MNNIFTILFFCCTVGADSLADSLDRPGTPSGVSAALSHRRKKLGRIFGDVQSSVSTFMKQQQQKIGRSDTIDDAAVSIGSSPQQLSSRFLSRCVYCAASILVWTSLCMGPLLQHTGITVFLSKKEHYSHIPFLYSGMFISSM